jgi:sugar phosphate isomerase/epimerase
MTLLIGAALGVSDLSSYADWLKEGQRDLELQTFHSFDVLTGDWQPLVDEVRGQLDGYTGRLGIHGPFWGFGIASQDPDVRAVVAKRMDQGLEVCAAVGATQMVIHSPYTTWDYNNLDLYETGRTGVIERAHETLRAAVRRAEDQGVTLVIENIEDIAPSDRLHLARSFDSEAVKLSIDTGHAHYAHITNGAPPVDYYVASAGNVLHHIHLQDSEGYADRHWAIGEGTIRWHAVFRALAMLDSQPRLILELRNKAGIPASMAFLKAEGLGH